MLMCTARRSLTRPLMQRGARACLHTDDVIALRSLLGKENVLDHDIDKYTTDWTKSYRGGGVVCLPGNTADVSAVLQYCNNRGIGVVPQGGNTGLVGGAVGRSAQELILSLSRMNRIFEVDADTRVLYCEAGCVLETLMQAAEAKNLVIPLDLGAKGSCMIGGNVSTNAGGLRVIKYGSLHSNVLGLEVVLADGSVVDALRGLRKDNCGYQSAHLFIGAEGTLGVVTKVAIALHSEPARVAVALIKVHRLVVSYGPVPHPSHLGRVVQGDHATAEAAERRIRRLPVCFRVHGLLIPGGHASALAGPVLQVRAALNVYVCQLYLRC